MDRKKTTYIGNIQFKILKNLPATNKDLCVKIYGVANEVTRNSMSQSLKSLISKGIIKKDENRQFHKIKDEINNSVVREGKNFKSVIVPFQFRKNLEIGKEIKLINKRNNEEYISKYNKTKRIQLKNLDNWVMNDIIEFENIEDSIEKKE